MGNKRVRFHLKGNWGQAVLAEGGILCVQILLTLAEWGIMLGLGVRIGSAMFLYPSTDIRPVLARMVIMIVLVVLDLLILSPLKLGRSVFYWQMVNSVRPVEGSRTRYFEGRLYGQAIHWRLRLWGWRLLWSLLLWLPAIALLGVGEWLRLDSLRRGAMDFTCVVFLLMGIIAFLGGWLVAEMVMMRYRPAAYGIGQGMKVKEAFRWAVTVTKGRTESILWLYLRYALGLLSCLFGLPALYVMPLFQTEQAWLIRKWAKLSPPLEKTAVLW